VIGGGFVIHREVLEQIGLFDERFFLYFEDAELTLRARARGIPVQFWDMPIVTHGVSQSTRTLGNPLLLRYHMRNALLFNWQNAPLPVKLLLPVWSIWTMIKQAVKIALMPSRRAPSSAIADGIIDFYAHRFGKIETHGRY